MRIDAGLDTGDILLQRELPIEPEDTAVTLAPALASMGADLLVETLHGLQAGAIRPQPQDPSRASLAPILKKEDGFADYSRTATEIFNRIRAFQPWPGVYTKFRGKNLQILAACVRPEELRAGELRIVSNRLLVGCAQNTCLEILELQLEGKKRTSSHDFIQGYRPEPHEKLG